MKIFDFVKDLHDECINLTEYIVFDKKHPRHLYLMGLYGTLIELAGSLVILLENRYKTGVPPLLRSILETYVELKNLCEREEYWCYMEASYHVQWIKVLKEAKLKPNPYLKAISEMDSLDDQIQEHEQNVARLKCKGYAPLTVFQRFEKASMEEEYRSLYNFLSNDTHSNIRALVNRHIEMDDRDFMVVYYKAEPIEASLTYIDSVAGLLTDASRRIHAFFGTGKDTIIENLHVKLSEIRNEY